MHSTYEGGRPELQILLDRDRAADLGISARSLAAASRTLVGGSDAGTFQADGRRYDVRVRLDESSRRTLSDVRSLPLRTGKGTLVDLSAVADVELTASASEIERINRARRISVLANTAPGAPLSVAVSRVDACLPQTRHPPVYRHKWKVRLDGRPRQARPSSFAFALAIVALYIVLANQFPTVLGSPSSSCSPRLSPSREPIS